MSCAKFLDCIDSIALVVCPCLPNPQGYRALRDGEEDAMLLDTLDDFAPEDPVKHVCPPSSPFENLKNISPFYIFFLISPFFQKSIAAAHVGVHRVCRTMMGALCGIRHDINTPRNPPPSNKPFKNHLFTFLILTSPFFFFFPLQENECIAVRSSLQAQQRAVFDVLTLRGQAAYLLLTPLEVLWYV